MRLAAESAWPGCGRIAWSSGAKTRSVPSWPSTDIAAAMSAVRSSIRRSLIASTSMPSMPSVPLISARPSLAASSTGARPAAASASAAGISVPVGVAHLALAHQRQRAVRQRRQVAGAAQRAVLAHDRRDPVRRAARRAAARSPRRMPVCPVASVESRSSISAAHHLALDLGPGAGGVRADQRALQLGAHLGRDVPGGQRTEAGGDAVRRRRRRGQLLDDRPRALHRGDRVLAEHHRRARRARPPPAPRTTPVRCPPPRPSLMLSILAVWAEPGQCRAGSGRLTSETWITST